ncbi:hypothetical protein D3C85_1067730 [compost metagenome]
MEIFIQVPVYPILEQIIMGLSQALLCLLINVHLLPKFPAEYTIGQEQMTINQE